MDFFSEKIIVGPHGVPDSPSLAQMTFTQCTSMSELKFDSGSFFGQKIFFSQNPLSSQDFDNASMI